MKSRNTKKKPKVTPFYIKYAKAHKGGVIKSLLHPEHASHMRVQRHLLSDRPLQNREYYRERLLRRMRKRFPNLTTAQHDWCDAKIRHRWANADLMRKHRVPFLPGPRKKIPNAPR